MNYRYVLILLCIVFCLLTYIVHVGGNYAREIAKYRIEKYCFKNQIPQEKMSAPCISKSRFYEWLFEYDSDTKPKHYVRLYIDVFGVVKEHCLIGEKDKLDTPSTQDAPNKR